MWQEDVCQGNVCDVTSHTVKSKVSPEEFGGTQELVFIDVPPPGGKTKALAVYLTPRLPAKAFGGRLNNEYLHDKRMVDQWTSRFASLQATPNLTTEENDILTRRFEQPLLATVFTPPRKCKASSPPDTDQDYAYLD